ncbi:MAG: hypothetical protein PHD05_08180, partial [Sphaerochaetaceae bacterium]|nr:hypothetical protein [Sphaerochaetaceae bacterium]
IASMATWALKAALCFFLVVDIMSKFNLFVKLTLWSEFTGVLYLFTRPLHHMGNQKLLTQTRDANLLVQGGLNI